VKSHTIECLMNVLELPGRFLERMQDSSGIPCLEDLCTTAKPRTARQHLEVNSHNLGHAFPISPLT
jgi:hypothetical protein